VAFDDFFVLIIQASFKGINEYLVPTMQATHQISVASGVASEWWDGSMKASILRKVGAGGTV